MDSYQATNGIFHRARTNNFTTCMEIQKTSNTGLGPRSQAPSPAIPTSMGLACPWPAGPPPGGGHESASTTPLVLRAGHGAVLVTGFLSAVKGFPPSQQEHFTVLCFQTKVRVRPLSTAGSHQPSYKGPAQPSATLTDQRV